MADTDESLLKSFAISRDENAFRILADRYLGLIFHTARRRTASRQLAEEVSQNILCALAKKASSLAKTPELLPAWLHRATIYETSKAMRAEASHQRAKQLQHPESLVAADAPQTSPWSEAIPHLDLALDKLPASDRRVLLLHFFENLPFPAIAQTLGSNPSAVQKQSRRALEKLARILRGRGVTLSATAIAAGLGGELAKAAPVALLDSATAAVLSGSATYSTTGLTLMFAMKSNVLIPLTLLLCAMPLVLQQVAISKVKGQNDELRRLALDNSATKSPDRHGSMVATGTRISSNLDIMTLVKEQDEARRAGGLKRTAFTEKLAALAPDVLVRLIGEAAVLSLQREKKAGILEALIGSLADKDVRLAVTTAVAAFPAGPELENLISQTGVTRRFGVWAAADPLAALAWFQAQEQSDKFNPASAPGFRDPIKGFKAPLIRALVGTANPQAIAILKSVAETARWSLLGDALRDFEPQKNKDKSGIAVRFMPVIREAFPHDLQEQALGAVGNSLAAGFDFDLEEASRFFTQADLSNEERAIIARSIAESTLGTSRSPLDAKRDARIDAEMRTWLQDVMPDLAGEIMESARDNVAASRAYQAQCTIKRLQEATDLTDRKLSSELMNGNLKSHRQEALDLAGKIQDPALRATTIEFLNKQ